MADGYRVGSADVPAGAPGAAPESESMRFQTTSKSFGVSILSETNTRPPTVAAQTTLVLLAVRAMYAVDRPGDARCRRALPAHRRSGLRPVRRRHGALL